MRPQRPYRALRAAVGTLVIAVVLGLWVYGRLHGDPLGTLWDVVLLALVIAAGMAVFGRRTFDDALEAAQEAAPAETDDADD